MYRKVETLILALAFVIEDVLNPSEAQAAILDMLRIMCEKADPIWKRAPVCLAVRFVESSAWSLIWTRIGYEYGHHPMTAPMLEDLELLLADHFEPLVEETTETARP
jgi:hypothetical protein